ncbi:hypothetical protein P4H71_26080 [Paenibacillus kribbensis]|uniref:hypothetical protein n=1 Tax=Paenibacillus kribbensis TaxID=172713 RepID=UPI002DBDAD31|nr:hypothetical protein [Paenibacillus kribbensis]MEC0237790.1 hypothetical protein [Paenibacillus kribbensis]
MDKKTLEWMNERVKKASAIREEIEAANKIIALLKSAESVMVRSNPSSVSITLHGRLAENKFLAEIEARMINVAIDGYEEEIKRLESEFEQL